MRTLFSVIASIAIAYISATVPAATAANVEFCVSTPSELVQAIDSFDSAASGSDIVVRVQQGTYAIGNLLGQVEHTSGARAVGIQILGGYGAGCSTRQLDPANTVLDGNLLADGGLHLRMQGNANALFEGLSFTRLAAGTQSDPEGAVLELSMSPGSSETARYEVRHCRFVGNPGHRIIEMSGPQMHLVNNLVASNMLTDATDVAIALTYADHADSAAIVTNNTIASNGSGSGLSIASGVQSGSRTSEIANNIFALHPASELLLDAFDAVHNRLRVHGNILRGSVVGYQPDASNLNLDPGFVDPLANDFSLLAGSPAINSGSQLQQFGLPMQALAGPRVIAARIDRGAFESAQGTFPDLVVTTTNDNGDNLNPLAGSLRAAIKAANAAGAPARIRFNLAGACPRVIVLGTSMIDVTGEVLIDATSQPGWQPNTRFDAFDATLCIGLDGNDTPATPWGLHVPMNATNASLEVRGIHFAGFRDAAIKIEGGRNHRIAGNRFGASDEHGASLQGVRIAGNSGPTFIGTYTDPSAVNLISGSASSAGIFLGNGAGGSIVAGNLIGFAPDGVGPAGNNSGIVVADSADNTIQYNSIGHHVGHGVFINGAAATGNVLQYNLIGTVQGNGSGVTIGSGAANNVIGAPLTADFGANAIVNNTFVGVQVTFAAGTGNRVLAGFFANNGGIDIDLNGQGASANQAVNPAVGPNNLQNYPVLTEAIRFAGPDPINVLSGTLHSTPNENFRIDVYAANSCDSAPGDRGRAHFFLGHRMIATDAIGNATFQLTLPAFRFTVGTGMVSATATDTAGNTSEIGNCIAETTPPELLFADGFE